MWDVFELNPVISGINSRTLDFVLIKHDLQGALFENGIRELIFSETATRKWRIGD